MHGFLTALRYLGLGLWWLLRNWILAPLHWVAQELFGQARTGLQRVLRPLLWPVVGLLIALFLFSNADDPQVAGLLQAIMTLGVICFGAWIIFQGRFPKEKAQLNMFGGGVAQSTPPSMHSPYRLRLLFQKLQHFFVPEDGFDVDAHALGVRFGEMFECMLHFRLDISFVHFHFFIRGQLIEKEL